MEGARRVESLEVSYFLLISSLQTHSYPAAPLAAVFVLVVLYPEFRHSQLHPRQPLALAAKRVGLHLVHTQVLDRSCPNVHQGRYTPPPNGERLESGEGIGDQL